MHWSQVEIGALARAASCAPSVHNSQPWALEVPDGVLRLYERFDVSLPRHDPTGRDRVLSCGAALANLDLAVRVLGWRPEVGLLPSPERADLVAEIRVAEPGEATPAELKRYSAIFQRSSYRSPFALHHVPPRLLRLLGDTAAGPGTEARLVQPRTEAAPLAELLAHAGQLLRADRAYQRELTAWTAQLREPPSRETTLPWSGLVRADTHLPDTVTLTERVAAESLLIVLTADDTRRDQLHAGAALERAWLAAITEGLVGSVLTQPLHLPEVRAGLIEKLGLPGYPQAILRIGYPVTATPGRVLAPTGAGKRG
ncbi:Acg family FMN-binding oxidoreductase [Amycolatopsis sp. 3B14]|uniref:Acg family FMN-binding oxidoreductase n=1 Tax=Amycolatopsis sp. 3B14 TaxID=3243600 RepID=UPI003D9837C9